MFFSRLLFLSLTLLLFIASSFTSGSVLSDFCVTNVTTESDVCFKLLNPIQRTEYRPECVSVSGLPFKISTVQEANDFINLIKPSLIYGIWIDAVKVAGESKYQWSDGTSAPGPLKWCKGSTKTFENLVLLCPFPDFSTFSATTCCVSDREDTTEFAAACIVQKPNNDTTTTIADVDPVSTIVSTTNTSTTTISVNPGLPVDTTTAAAIPPVDTTTTTSTLTIIATTTTTPAPVVVNPDEPDDFNKEGVQTHNELRAKHGVDALIYSKALRDQAQEWADKLAAEDDFSLTHRPDNPNGENIALGNPSLTAKEASEMWYNEIKSYDFTKNDAIDGLGFGDIGHFTQLVWSTTTSVGFGVATSENGNVFVVANYAPPGNVNIPENFATFVKPLV